MGGCSHSSLGWLLLACSSATSLSHSSERERASAAPRSLHLSLAADDHPVVIMHGIAESADSDAMQKLVASVEATYPQKKVIALSVSDGLASMLREMNPQLEELAEAIKSNPLLQNG